MDDGISLEASILTRLFTDGNNLDFEVNESGNKSSPGFALLGERIKQCRSGVALVLLLCLTLKTIFSQPDEVGDNVFMKGLSVRNLSDPEYLYLEVVLSIVILYSTAPFRIRN